MGQCYLYLLVAQLAQLFASGQCNLYVTGLDVLYQWSTPDYTWPSHAERDEAIRSERYVPKNILIWDTSVYFYNKRDQRSCGKTKTLTFVTTPRTKLEGIPVTVSTVDTIGGRYNPLLKPFPNWEYNRPGNCNGITSAYRTEMDTCQRLWILDTGTVGNKPDGTLKRVCQPKIHIFDDLGSGGRLVGTFLVPDDVLVCDSFLSTIVIDPVYEHAPCEHAFAYITDTFGNGLIVFSLRNKTFSRAVHNSFFPDPNYGDFSVAGVHFQDMSGIIGHSLSPIRDGHRNFYYYPFSNTKQSAVDTSIIRDQKAFLANPRAHKDSFYTYSKETLSQGSADCMNSDGIYLYNYLSQNAVACWNSQRDPNFLQTPVLSQNDTTMQFISAMQVYDYRLYAVSSRAENYYYGTVSPHEINYRLLYACVPELTRGTACESAEVQYESHYQFERHYEDYEY